MTKYLATDTDRANARKLTDQIKKAADNLWELLFEAWNSKAYASLGYRTWSAYVDAEFDFNRQHSYRLINQGHVIKQLRAAAELSPTGDTITVTERESRDIAPVIGEVVDEVRERVAAGVPGVEAVRMAVTAHRPPPVTRARLYDASVSDDGDVFYDEPVACVHEYVCRHCGEALNA